MSLNGMVIDGVCYTDYQTAKDEYTNFVAHIATPINTVLQPDTLDIYIPDAQGAYSIMNAQSLSPAGDFYTQFAKCDSAIYSSSSSVALYCVLIIAVFFSFFFGFRTGFRP